MNNKEIFAKNLDYYLSMNNMTRAELARTLKYPETTVSNWVNAISYPRIGKIQEMADFFGIFKSDLTELKDLNSEKDKLNKNYDLLSTEGKHTLVYYSDALVNNEKDRIKEDELYSVEVTESVTAGLGYQYGNNETATYYIDRNDLKNYYYATLVRGDSMEPTYNDGDIILVKAGYDNSNGDVYVIDYDGKLYVKKLYNDGDRFRLVSINRDYENIIIDLPIKEGLYFNIVGKVIQILTTSRNK